MTNESAPGRAVLCIGLFGGIGAGKSMIAGLLAAQGAGVVDSDAIAHECLSDPEIRDALVAAFGADICDGAGAIDRPALAAKAFANDDGTAQLNAIVHPAVSARMQEQLDAFAAAGTRVAVLDGAVLTEAGWSDRCDWRLFIDVPEMVREARVQGRGWAPGERERREARQVSVDLKKAAADAIVRNDGTPANAKAEVEAFWEQHVVPRLAASAT